MEKLRKDQESFVLVYADDRDPSREETAQALALLQPFSVEEVVPGTIRVTGDRDRVVRSVHDLDRWQLSSEKRLNLNPPYKSQLR